MRNLFKRKKKHNIRASITVTPSCENNETRYIDFHDGLRLVVREGEYAGWYLPGGTADG